MTPLGVVAKAGFEPGDHLGSSTSLGSKGRSATSLPLEE